MFIQNVRKEKGFSLIEVVIVITIMGVVMAGFILPMLGQIKIRNQLLELQKYKETNRTLEEIKQALLGYVAVNKYFPCPDFDVTPDGQGGDQSNCNTAAKAFEGYVPWVDLGLTKGTDAWGNPVRYRVHHKYAYFFDTTTSKNFEISTLNPDVNANPVLQVKDETEKTISITNSIAIILLSCGKNGKPDSTTNESNNRTGNQNCFNVANPAINNSYYIQDTRNYSTELENIPTDFDDVVTWISKFQVINALNNAGKWK